MGLEEGLYVWTPGGASGRPGEEAYLIVWPGLHTFSPKPSRSAAYCSTFRYAVELSHDVLVLFDEVTMAGFDPRMYPFR